MATTSGGVNNDTEGLFRAVLNELNRVIGDDPTGWTVHKRLPAVVQASQLSVYGLLVLNAVQGPNGDIFTHREKLAALLDKVLQKSKGVWAEGLTKKPSTRHKYLEDVKPIQPAVRAVVKLAEKNISLHGERLWGFGVYDLQDTLAGLVGRVSEALEAKLAVGRSGAVPGAVHAAIGLGMLAGGLAGRREMAPKEVSAARVLSRMGSKKDEAGGPEPKPVKKVRKTLKELAAHLPEQRG